MLRPCLLAALVFAPALSAQQLAPAERARIDSMIERVLAYNVTPGFGVVVVRDTQVVYMKGFGFADLEAKRPFTPQTVFYTGSTTKAFTGLAATILDLQGSFKLDAPLSRYLPAARLKAPLNPDSITIRSLITHTHDISASAVQYRLAFSGEYRDNAELIALLSAAAQPLPNRDFRYSNLGYNITALAMDHVTGESWKQTLNRLIFTPLGMRSTTAYLSRVPEERLAMPYKMSPDGFRRLPYGKVDATMQSAGGLVTTLEDEARWLEAQLNDGKIDGRQIIPAAVFRETHKVQVNTGQKVRDIQLFGYGFGWHLGIYRGDTLVHHGGGFPGFNAYIALVPDRRLGVVTFSNSYHLGDALVETIGLGVLDVLAGRNAMAEDSLALFRNAAERTRTGIKSDLDRRAARPQTTALPFGAYVGRYEHPLIGSLVFALTPGGKLEARAGAMASPVEVFDGSKYQLRAELFGFGQVIQMEVENGQVVAATLDGDRYVKVK